MILKKIIRKTAFVAILLVAVSTQPAKADNTVDTLERPVTGTYGIETGRRTALDTYLSPLPYSGTWLAAYGNWQKALPFAPRHAVMEFDALAGGGRLINKAGTAMELNIDIRLAFGMKWRTTLPSRTQISTGAEFGIDGGALYLTRNSNNPASVKASAALSLTAGASHRIKIGRLPVLIYDQLRLPSLSVFFSPSFGETYYEIYLGNHSGLAHAGWWGNNFRIDNLFGATIDFGRTAMTVGYRFRTDTSWICNLNTRIMTHSFVIGVIPGGIGLKQSHPKKNYAIY